MTEQKTYEVKLNQISSNEENGPSFVFDVKGETVETTIVTSSETCNDDCEISSYKMRLAGSPSSEAVKTLQHFFEAHEVGRTQKACAILPDEDIILRRDLNNPRECELCIPGSKFRGKLAIVIQEVLKKHNYNDQEYEVSSDYS